MSEKRKLRKKIIENYFVDLNDCIPFEQRSSDLPYLKYIPLTMSRPSDYDLAHGWTRRFEIPNHRMKKIYWQEIYYDDEEETPKEPEVEGFRIELINNYMNYRQYPPEAQKRQCKLGLKPPLDTLLECLVEADKRQKKYSESNKSCVDRNLKKRLRRSKAVELNSDNIAICRKHLIQPEEAIIKIALSKMNNLDVREEQRFKNLIGDEKFMAMLQKHVEKCTNASNERC